MQFKYWKVDKKKFGDRRYVITEAKTGLVLYEWKDGKWSLYEEDDVYVDGNSGIFVISQTKDEILLNVPLPAELEEDTQQE